MEAYSIRDPKDGRRKFPLVMVKWVDARGDSAWQSLAQARKQTLVNCVTVGFLLSKTKDWVTIGGQYVKDEQDWAEVTTIPRTWQIEIIPLGVVDGT